MWIVYLFGEREHKFHNICIELIEGAKVRIAIVPGLKKFFAHLEHKISNVFQNFNAFVCVPKNTIKKSGIQFRIMLKINVLVAKLGN